MSLFSRLFGSSKKQEPVVDPRSVLAEGEEWADPVEWYIDTDGKSFRRKKKKCCGGGCHTQDIGVAEVVDVSTSVEDVAIATVIMNNVVSESAPSYINPEPAVGYDPPAHSAPSHSSYDSDSGSSSSSYDSGSSSSSYDSGSSFSDSGSSCGGCGD
jgi:uncharacterized membrane protein YgcG